MMIAAKTLSPSQLDDIRARLTLAMPADAGHPQLCQCGAVHAIRSTGFDRARYQREMVRVDVPALLDHIEALQALAEIGQASIDYADSGDCTHCALTEDGCHDEECPVGEYIATAAATAPKETV